MSIDRGDPHFEDAGNWTKACRHIALFLWWAAERTLSSDEVDAIAEHERVADGSASRATCGNCGTRALWSGAASVGIPTCTRIGATGSRLVMTATTRRRPWHLGH